MFTMPECFSLTEVSKMTGLAPHTLRYYEQQFPKQLRVERTQGGHRKYNSQQLEMLGEIVNLLKNERLSIKQARAALQARQEGAAGDEGLGLGLDGVKASQAGEKNKICELLSLVVEKLDHICRNDENRDILLMSYLQAQSEQQNQDLIQQIARCRKETHETVKLCQTIIRQGFKVN
jgi:DNA-binding transcriptional MerR regulator